VLGGLLDEGSKGKVSQRGSNRCFRVALCKGIILKVIILGGQRPLRGGSEVQGNKPKRIERPIGVRQVEIGGGRLAEGVLRW